MCFILLTVTSAAPLLHSEHTAAMLWQHLQYLLHCWQRNFSFSMATIIMQTDHNVTLYVNTYPVVVFSCRLLLLGWVTKLYQVKIVCNCRIGYNTLYINCRYIYSQSINQSLNQSNNQSLSPCLSVRPTIHRRNCISVHLAIIPSTHYLPTNLI